MKHNLLNFGVLKRISNLLMQNEALVESLEKLDTIGSGLWFNKDTDRVELKLYVLPDHEDVVPLKPVIVNLDGTDYQIDIVFEKRNGAKAY